MTPDTQGVWRWKRKRDGRVFDLPIFNVVPKSIHPKWLRVYFLGGYYDLSEMDGGEFTEKIDDNPHGPITEQHAFWVHPLDYPS